MKTFLARIAGVVGTVGTVAAIIVAFYFVKDRYDPPPASAPPSPPPAPASLLVAGHVAGVRDDDPLEVEITIKNVGGSPAKDLTPEVRVWWEVVHQPGEKMAGAMPGPGTAGEWPMQIQPEKPTTLVSTDEYVLPCPPPKAHNKSELLSRKVILRAIGTIHYKTIDGRSREFDFEYSQGGQGHDPKASSMTIEKNEEVTPE